MCLESSDKERRKKVTREGTSVNRKQVKRVCEMEHFGSFLGCLSEEKLKKRRFVPRFRCMYYMFSMRISLVLAWILLVFYYSSIMIMIISLVFSSSSVVIIIIKRVVG